MGYGEIVLKRKKCFGLLLWVILILPLISCQRTDSYSTAQIDPFENLEVSFYGNPNRGYADIDSSLCSQFVRENFRFECKNNGSLSNGGRAVLTATKFYNDDIEILRYQKEYIVTGVEFYPEKIAEYEKEALNKAIRKYADNYIKNNIETFPMRYYSDLDRTGWNESGAFTYYYDYHDIKMMYSVHKRDLSQNAYFIVYELSNRIECTQDMDKSHKAPMKKGESDTGEAYVVVGVKGIKANSDKMFIGDVSDMVVGVFETVTQAENFCTYRGEYDTFTENFV